MSDWEFLQDDENFEQLEITSAQTPSPAPKKAGPSLKARAIDLLSRREHSRVELRRKLLRHAEDPDQVDSLLDELAQQNWQSDERFVRSHLNRRANKFGTYRLLQELRQHGVDESHIQAAQTDLKETEFERAYDIWERKFGQAPTDQKAYAKQYRFMANRGFGSGVLRRILERFNDTL